jgi:hypothetical protein
MAVIHREILAEVPPRAGMTFGHGSDWMRIVSAERAQSDLYLTVVQTRPIWGYLNFQEFPFWTFRSLVFFNRADREIMKTLGRISPQNTTYNFTLNAIGGVSISRLVYQVHTPREYFPDKPVGQRLGPIDPQWLEGVSVVWTQSRPVARFETEIVEPHFAVRDEIPTLAQTRR